ncbi:tRNA (adenine(22)-N(1))-methyltransferase [Streptococcus halichoeri]|uniref:tRNA (adenine(22)-N(1))-methyltransferase n=1 Tax=Streptococcus halichoeri TaxID=254785 RepID=UPI0013596AEE|nr:tRNA (adenine(22)-N(1))-methyltransferase TrmK [Streptococcus halichoeri]
MEHLSKRLSLVAEKIPPGSRLLDVGSDHAYLPIYLASQGLIDRAVAGEVVKGPYESACRNVAAHGLQQVISVRLANGLAAMQAEDGITAVSICGMGGRLIADILGADQAQLATVKTLVLQPNNREDELRQWLVAHQFAIVAETILMENDKYYEIIVAQPGHQMLDAKAYRFGPFLSQAKTAVFKAKWHREYVKLAEALACVPHARTKDRAAITQKMAAIKEMIEDEGK